MKTKKFKFTSVRNWELTRDVAAGAAALTSVAVIWSIVYFNVLDVFGYKIIAGAFSAVVVVAALFVIDWGLRVDLPYAFELLISGRAWGNWRIATFLVLLLGFNLIRSAATITLSWQGRKDMVTAVMEEPETADLAKTKSDIDASGAAKINAARESIAKVEKRAKNAEKRVREENKRLDSLARAGNTWASRKLSSEIKKATWQDRKALNEAQSALTLLLEAETRAGNVALQEIARADREKLVDFRGDAKRNMAYLGYFGAGCTCVVILISFMLALINVVEQELPQYAKRYAVSTPPHAMPVAASSAEDLLATIAWQSKEISERDAVLSQLRDEVNQLKEKATPTEATEEESPRAHARTGAPNADADADARTRADERADAHGRTRAHAHARDLTCKQCEKGYSSEQEGSSRKFCSSKCRDEYQASKGRK